MSITDRSLIRNWAASRGIEPPGGVPSGKLSLTIDRVRVHLVALKFDEVLVEARISDLPRQNAERTRYLEKALSLATARIVACAATLVVDPAGSTLKLQARVPGQASPDDLDKTVAMLVSEVEMWRTVL